MRHRALRKEAPAADVEWLDITGVRRTRLDGNPLVNGRRRPTKRTGHGNMQRRSSDDDMPMQERVVKSLSHPDGSLPRSEQTKGMGGRCRRPSNIAGDGSYNLDGNRSIAGACKP
jgi:hypothetical protein